MKSAAQNGVSKAVEALGAIMHDVVKAGLSKVATAIKGASAGESAGGV
ncbi:hypothetical protein [Borreliella americana]|nr:hypothetical protein [Borreliella americana]MCD2332860.1 hypothetical protein [Borreliella americana]MCD2349929.1 hypothetical protein [Borreliella americana]MCD2382765.1 hypothetical protein [Borreliella americana]